MELCREQGFALLLAGGRVLRGWSQTEQGGVEEGIAQTRQGLADWQATGALSHRPYQLALLAFALARAGRAAEGLSAVAEALSLSGATGERFFEAELHRLQGELLGPGEAAEACFRRGVDVARRQGARSLELRAVLSLARRLREQGRAAEGWGLLEEVYG